MSRRCDLHDAVVGLARELPEDAASFVMVLCALGLLKTPTGTVSLATFCRVHGFDEVQVVADVTSGDESLVSRWPQMDDWGRIGIEAWAYWVASSRDETLAALRDRIVAVGQVTLRQRRASWRESGSSS